jgi:hypothetical protein
MQQTISKFINYKTCVLGMKKFIFIAFISCFTISGFTQDKAITWSSQFDEYQKTWPRLEITAVFNQQKYSPGDTAFLKLYITLKNRTRTSGKQLAEINLIDSNGISILKTLINVTDGIGKNQLIIPSSTPPGIYLMTAHTQFMKNFSPVHVYKKEIEVVEKNRIIRVPEKTLQVAIEGQHMIGGVKNKIVFKTGASQQTAELISNASKVGSLSTDLNGIGSFTFVPNIKEKYFLKLSNDTITAKLPPVEESGYKLRVANDSILITPVSAESGSVLTLVAVANGTVRFTKSFLQSPSKETTLLVKEMNLPGGVVHLSLLDKSGNAFANRSLFLDKKETARCDLSTDKTSYKIREKGTVNIKLADANGAPVTGEFSMSITNSALFDKNRNSLFSDEMKVLSNLENIYDIDRSASNWYSSLDDILILENPEIPWKKINSEKLSQPIIPFNNPRQKIGTVVFSNTGEPVPDQTQVIFYLQKSKWRYQTFTLNKGTVRLTLPELFEDDEFFFTAESEKGKELQNIAVNWLDENIPLPKASATKEEPILDVYASYNSRKRLVDKSYGISTAINISAKNISGNRFEDLVNGADVVVNVEDFLSFGSMIELIREIIPSLFHRSIGGKDRIHVVLPEPLMAQSSGDPIYVIDDVVTKNTDFFLSLKPSELLTVKVIKDAKKLARLNLMGKNGVVIVNTKSGNTREPVKIANVVSGLSRPLNFNNAISTSDKRKPIFRSTLYWNPSIEADQNGIAKIEFNTSDDIGRFIIQIDGLLQDGTPFSASKIIDVSAEVQH